VHCTELVNPYPPKYLVHPFLAFTVADVPYNVRLLILVIVYSVLLLATLVLLSVLTLLIYRLLEPPAVPVPNP
jgi:hypothetical protein